MKISTVLLILLHCLIIQLQPLNSSTLQSKWVQKEVTASRLLEKVIIVGKLDEIIWKKEPVTGFTQIEPKKGEPVFRRTPETDKNGDKQREKYQREGC